MAFFEILKTCQNVEGLGPARSAVWDYHALTGQKKLPGLTQTCRALEQRPGLT